MIQRKVLGFREQPRGKVKAFFTLLWLLARNRLYWLLASYIFILVTFTAFKSLYQILKSVFRPSKDGNTWPC